MEQEKKEQKEINQQQQQIINQQIDEIQQMEQIIDDQNKTNQEQQQTINQQNERIQVLEQEINEKYDEIEQLEQRLYEEIIQTFSIDEAINDEQEFLRKVSIILDDLEIENIIVNANPSQWDGSDTNIQFSLCGDSLEEINEAKNKFVTFIKDIAPPNHMSLEVTNTLNSECTFWRGFYWTLYPRN